VIGFRRSAQVALPPARRIKDDVIMRFDHVYEVDPELMQIYPQQDIPVWDTERIIDAKWDHLDWMHQHFAERVVGAKELGLDPKYLGDDGKESNGHD
jgi:hypothetical protein